MKRQRLTALVVASLTGLAACSDDTGPRILENTVGVIVSAPVRLGAATAAALGRASAAAGAGLPVVYVSLPPGSVPMGVLVTISDQATGLSITTAVVNGGFDPVPIAASVGDTLTVEITGSGALAQAQVVVAGARPLKIVRTSPPSGGRDVPLNAIIVVVFSEPIAPTTVDTTTVALTIGTTRVRGEVALSSDGLRVSITPDSLLVPNREYVLSLATGITNAAGLALVAPVKSSFTTIALGVGSRLTVTPGTVALAPGATQQFSAVLRDSTGKAFSFSPVWTVLAGGGTISPTGLFTAGTAAGVYPFAVQAADLTNSTEAWATVTVAAPSAGLQFTGVSAGGQHTCGLTTAGAAYCWGDNTHGALGNGTTTSSAIPVAVLLAPPFSDLNAGGTHTCGTQPSPYVDNYVTYCWGGNAYGQLGDGTTVDKLSPLAVSNSLEGLFKGGGGAFVGAGQNHTCVLDNWNFGVDFCWGANDRGQLGDSTTIGRLIPQLIWDSHGYVNHVETVTIGASHTCGEYPGTNYPASILWYCWGANDQGQLGDGTTTDRIWPVIVGGGTSFATSGLGRVMSAGAQHTCGVAAFTGAGAAYCWGANGNGQLGDGTTTQRSTPTPVVGGLTFVVVTAGGNHTCGLTSAGAAYCWGANSNGQLGDGTTTQSTSPVPVAGGLSFSGLSAGASHTCGITLAGVAYCWGSNSYGQLGNGTTTDSSVPVKVAGQQ